MSNGTPLSDGMEQSIRSDERKQIVEALVTFLEDDGGTFRKLIPLLGLDYSKAYEEGWMAVTNALVDYGERIQGINGMTL